MEWYQVLLLITVLLAFLYVALFVYVFGQIHEFRTRLKRRINGLSLLLSQRRDDILAIVAIIQKMGISIDEEDLACFHKMEEMDVSAPNEAKVLANVAIVKEATSRLQAICENQTEICDNEAFKLHAGLLADLEKNYRSLVGVYNADVIGYNYWIAIFSFRSIAKLFGNKPRGLLN